MVTAAPLKRATVGWVWDPIPVAHVSGPPCSIRAHEPYNARYGRGTYASQLPPPQLFTLLLQRSLQFGGPQTGGKRPQSQSNRRQPQWYRRSNAQEPQGHRRRAWGHRATPLADNGEGQKVLLPNRAWGSLGSRNLKPVLYCHQLVNKERPLIL